MNWELHEVEVMFSGCNKWSVMQRICDKVGREKQKRLKKLWCRSQMLLESASSLVEWNEGQKRP